MCLSCTSLVETLFRLLISINTKNIGLHILLHPVIECHSVSLAAVQCMQIKATIFQYLINLRKIFHTLPTLALRHLGYDCSVVHPIGGIRVSACISLQKQISTNCNFPPSPPLVTTFSGDNLQMLERTRSDHSASALQLGISQVIQPPGMFVCRHTDA